MFPDIVPEFLARSIYLNNTLARMFFDQIARLPLGNDPALIKDHQPVAQMLGLIHVMGG